MISQRTIVLLVWETFLNVVFRMITIFGAKRPRNDLETRIAKLEALVEEIRDSENRRDIHWKSLEADVTDLVDKLAKQLAKYRQRDIRAAKAEKNEEEGGQAQLQLSPQQSPADRKAALRRQLFQG